MAQRVASISSPDPERNGVNKSSTNLRPAHEAREGASQASFAPQVPSFLAPEVDAAGDESPQEIMPVLRRGPFTSVSSKVMVAVAAAAIAATLFAWLTSDATRDIVSATRDVVKRAKASIASAASPETASAEQEAAKSIPSEASSKVAEGAGAAAQPPGRAPAAVAVATPSREEISNAYRRAAGVAPPAAPGDAAPQPTTSPAAPQPPTSPAATPQAAAPAAAPPQPAPAPAPAPAFARQISAPELAVLVGRARDLLSSGDIVSARLLLERAAEARDAGAALLLAQTYDPDVLGTSDVRNITPEPSTARAWYEKAAKLGSAEAQRRLAQLPN